MKSSISRYEVFDWEIMGNDMWRWLPNTCGWVHDGTVLGTIIEKKKSIFVIEMVQLKGVLEYVYCSELAEAAILSLTYNYKLLLYGRSTI